MNIGFLGFRFLLSLWLTILAFGSPVSLSAQEYIVHRSKEGDKLRFRWEPQSWEAFDQILSAEMALDIYAVSGPATRPELRLIDQKLVAPTALNEWMTGLETTNWDSSALAAVYVDELPPAFREKTFLAKEYEDSPAEELENRWQVSNYVLNYSWPAIKNSGMGHELTIDPGVSTYAAKLYPTPSGDTIYFDFNLKEYTVPILPEFYADWQDLRVELSWRTLEYRDVYFGWMVQKSVNDGDFTDLFELPLINDQDTMDLESDALKSIYHTNNLENNDDKITFRLRGYNFLGGASEAYREITGSGLNDIQYSPLLTKTTQTDSNYVVIDWDFDEDQESLVEEFRIIHKDSLDGEYEIALQGIEPSARRASIPMKYRANYYRVQAVSVVGTVYSSFESLVLAYDDDPPAVPRDFTGYIDSLGIAHLSWVTSNEPDLKGYYLFKGYFKDTELAMITPTPLQGPTHLDTTKVEVAYETIYFQLRSVDFRGNSSNFTPILELKKPDIYPPAAPQIVDAKNDGKKISIRWVKSPSNDVASYTLYRRELENSADWAPILEFSAEAFQRSYVDSLVAPGQAYAYSLIATDDDGLVSERSQPISQRVRDYGLRSPIENLTATSASEENKTIRLTWSYDERPREFHLYKGEEDNPVSLLKVISGNLREYTDNAVRKRLTYKYLIRAIFPNGKVSPFTEEVSFKLE